MKPSYTFIDHTADVLFEAQAPDLENLFIQCGLALQETQINLEKVEPKEKTEFTAEHKDIEGLLFDFLDELLFLKDSEQLVFNKFEIKINQQEGKYHLSCTAHGEKLDVVKHEPKVDVKAITMHLFEVQKVEGGWKAKVLVDI